MDKKTENSLNKSANKSSATNTVGISNRPASSIDTNFNKLLHEAHRIFVQTLHPRLNDFFEGLNDFFFDMAEQAESNALQNAYFTAIGDTRKNKTELTKQFAKNVNLIFQKFKSNDFVYFIESAKSSKSDKKDLSLIKEDDLDQKLAINNVIAKISQVYTKDLFLLNARFAELANQDELEKHANPVGPDAIVNAFALSLKVLKSENNIKLMIIKLFEKNMVESLGPAYRMVNKHFKKNDVLPDIKFEIKHRASANHAVNNSINYLAQALSEEDENYKKIANILENDREQPAQQSYTNENIVQFSQLSDALNQITVELFSGQELEAKQSISPLELKDELIRKLKSLKAISKGQQINADDENTIDLIGELFQYMVEDRNLPETIQLVLSKLQLPFLQIALKDKTFFSDKHNNARKLLNIIAESSIGWSPEVDNKSVFLNKVKEIVEFIIENHEKNINYEKLIERFIAFDNKLKKRSSITEKRTTAQVSGREKLNTAKIKAAKILKRNLKGKKIPKLVREILLKPWANVLILSELRKHETPEILSKHRDFVFNLVSASNKDELTKASASDIKELCHELEYGLKLVAYDATEINAKTSALRDCLTEINTSESKELDIDFIDPEEVLKLSKEFNKESSVGELLDKKDLNAFAPKDLNEIDDVHNQASLTLVLGEWIEIDSKSNPKRVKLSWVSPISGKMLFVDGKGNKILNIFPIELADKFRKEEYLTMQQVPLMDRAMESIANKMNAKKQTA